MSSLQCPIFDVAPFGPGRAKSPNNVPDPGQFFNKGQRNRRAERQPRDKFNSAVDILDNPQGTDLPVWFVFNASRSEASLGSHTRWADGLPPVTSPVPS
ncbi:hypothetical protein E5D57_002819 [Metarhizium anisopliae]|nr:hypothetical protein E5D57_002819 [Metarhizium anisopliae]